MLWNQGLTTITKGQNQILPCNTRSLWWSLYDDYSSSDPEKESENYQLSHLLFE